LKAQRAREVNAIAMETGSGVENPGQPLPDPVARGHGVSSFGPRDKASVVF